METSPSIRQALAGRYDLIEEIGRGGMAVVYLANDVRHQRRVAVKVLHPELAAVIGTERFLSEIRITAGLQHPNLLPLFDSGEADGVPYYVMPFVEGESLRDRLQREGQLPVSETVALGAKLASAIDHAHRAGVVHRDLKPENILLRDGEPVIADFGIALAVTNAGGNRLTQTGLSVGTPQYMSPEQASAERTIDGRADIYALGAILYEMLCGEPPHTGPTAQAVLAKVVAEPTRSMRVTRPAIPATVDAAVLRALEKVPADRWPSGRDMATALQAPSIDSGAMSGGRRPWVPIAGVGIASLVIGAVAGSLVARSRNQQSSLSYRYLLTLPESAAVTTGQGASGSDVAISRDGRTLLYVAGPTSGSESSRGIWRRELDEWEAHPVPGITSGASPRISPDGSRVMYVVNGSLRVTGLSNGETSTIGTRASSADWIDSRSAVFSRGATFWLTARQEAVNLWIATIGDTIPRQLTTLDSTSAVHGVAFPNVLPGGRKALATIWKGQGTSVSAQLAVVSLENGAITELAIAGSNPRYAQGQMVFVKDDGALHAMAFDAGSGRVSGTESELAPHVLVKLSATADFDVSDNGTLVYIAGSDFRRRLVTVNRNGVSRPMLPDLKRFYTPRVSPDGRRVAVEVGLLSGFDIWTYDLTSGTFGALTTGGRSARTGGWSADGSKVAMLAFEPNVKTQAITQAADGSGRSEILAPWTTSVADVSLFGNSYAVMTNAGQIEMPGKDKTAPRVIIPASERIAVMRFSNDGALVAYEARGREPVDVYARSVADGTQIQVSSGGGREPMWSRSGDQLYYRGATFMMAATIARNPLRVIRRDTLFRDTFLRGAIASNYDVFPNGQFVMIERENPDVNPTVVLNALKPPR